MSGWRSAGRMYGVASMNLQRLVGRPIASEALKHIASLYADIRK
jgi:hypothetical protein